MDPVSYLYEPEVHIAWGPFFTYDELDYFQGISDKDTGIVVTEKMIKERYKNLRLKVPEDFDPYWARNYGVPISEVTDL